MKRAAMEGMASTSIIVMFIYTMHVLNRMCMS